MITGLILERLTGVGLHQQLREEIFGPLGMRCTWMYFEEPVPQGCDDPTHSYDGELDVTENWLQSADWSGGGLYSTLDDQLRLLRGLFHEGFLSKESLAKMKGWENNEQDGSIDYGLGLYQTSAGPGMTLIGHTGIHNSFMFLWEEAGILLTGSLNQLENSALEELVYPAIRVLQESGGYVDHSH